MNPKIKKFAEKASLELNKIEARVNQSIANDALIIDSILLECFNNQSPYTGETKNKVFFTYSDHYRGNSPTWMSVGSVNHPHVNYEDRGYIKGVATDLDGYMKLKLLFATSNIYNSLYSYTPKFNASKNKAAYTTAVNQIKDDFENSVKKLAENRVEKANEILKAKTDMSLRYYMRNL